MSLETGSEGSTMANELSRRGGIGMTSQRTRERLIQRL